LAYSKILHDIRSFHGLASFYHQFIKNFSSIVALLIECLKQDAFTWNMKAQKSFEVLKEKISSTLVLSLPNFDLMFEVDCDASNVGIRVVLSQEGRLIAFFSEKLNDAKMKYSTYDKELYAIVQALNHWSHYLLPREFILYIDMRLLNILTLNKSWIDVIHFGMSFFSLFHFYSNIKQALKIRSQMP